MELFDLLEKRVTELLEQLDALREENRTLLETAQGLSELREENRTLREVLEQERQVRGQIEGRIDAMLSRIGEHLGDA